jgi:PAS domain S-box-containing protein
MFSVLYVDDEPDLLELGQMFLEKSGEFSVAISTSAEEALESPSIRSYDVIISDYQMPGMDGIAFLKAVRERFGDIPFILFTGRGREEVVIDAINNGADFYLQKGGDPKSQFAELSHKIRQSVRRNQAEHSLHESERRLSDIIDFLPDATFAIDRSGQVIAWNRAIEEMTGIPAGDMLGKGDYEYAIPFYGSRRRILIDLIDEQNEKIADFYSDIYRTGNSVTAETDLPHPKGYQITVLARAGPLYNQSGEIIGAIESIRDISAGKRDIAALQQISTELELIFKNMINAFVVWESVFDENGNYASFRFGKFNDAYARIAKVKYEDVKGKDVFEVWPTTERSWVEVYGRVATTGIPHTFDMYHEPTKGWAHCNAYRPTDSPAQVCVIFEDITERRRAETELLAAYEQITASEEELRGQYEELVKSEQRIRESEEKFRVLADTAPMGIIVIQGTRDIYINNHVARSTGYSKEEIIAMNFWDIIHPDQREQVKESGLAWLRGERPSTTKEIQYVTKSGENRWALLSEGKIEYGGKSAGIVLVLGITDRKKTEEELRTAYEQLAMVNEKLQEQYDALKESQKRIQKSEFDYRSIVENIQDAFYRTDMQGNLLMISPSFVKEFGYSGEKELLGKNVRETFYVNPKDRDVFLKQLESSGHITERRVTLRRYDGSPVVVSAASHIYYDENGKPAGVEGTLHDLTEIIRAEEALSKNQHVLAEAMDLANLVNWEYNVKTGMFNFNDRFYAQCGTTAEREGGYKMPAEVFAREFVHPEDRGAVAEEIKKAAKVTDPHYISQREHRIIRKDGKVRHIIVRIEVVKDADGRVIKAQGANQDITERKNAEEALRLANRQLNLLTGITRHDILNKVAIIMGYLKIAELKFEDPALVEFTGRIKSATMAIQSQIEFTRIYENIGTHEPRWIALETVMPRSQVPAMITLVADVSGVEVFSDPMLEKVFFNLLDNSIRHGERVTEIRVSSHKYDENLVVVWEDNGIGIDASEKEQIFERGFGKNTGLGLFLVREILFLTGITIIEKGEPGKSARFEITVPNGEYRISHK